MNSMQFRWSPIYWWITIPTLLVLNFIAYYDPLCSSLKYLGPLGNFTSRLGTERPDIAFGLNVFALVAHIFEAAYAFYVCKKRNAPLGVTFQWIVQTFILGFGSLYYIHKQPRKKKN